MNSSCYKLETADVMKNRHNFIWIFRFSFVISRRGEMTHVYHPSNEDSDVIATKKGFAALFASRLHEEGDVI